MRAHIIKHLDVSLLYMRLLAIGDNCVDAYRELDVSFPGGNALNVAVYSSRLSGIQAEYIGVVGTDERGDFILDQMRRNGLSTDHVKRIAGETAVTTISVRDGDRFFDEYIEGVQEEATFPCEELDYIMDFDLIHYTVWGFGREYVSEIKKRGGPLLSCDFSAEIHNPKTDIMPHLDYSFFSGRHLLGEWKELQRIIEKLGERTRGVVVMTLGEHGSLAFDGIKMYRGKAIPIKVVDTLGAGDAFIASFLGSQLLGTNIPKSLAEGHIAASEICGRLGAWGEV